MVKFTNSERINIISWAEKYGNKSAALQFNLSNTWVGKIRKRKNEILGKLKDAEHADILANIHRRYSKKNPDGSVTKEWKLVRSNERKYMLAKFRDGQKRGRPTDVRYIIFDEYLY